LTTTNLKIVAHRSLKELGGKIFQIVFMVSEQVLKKKIRDTRWQKYF
jgi:hypothetical protein